MTLYDLDYLRVARQTLGITDMWVTFSWGFADTTEQPDRMFITQRLERFHAQNICAHAYVQGLNLVTDDFKGSDVFCQDGSGRLQPYSRGRSLTCANNPHARQIIMDRVVAACQADFAGVFVDNILFGLPPFYARRDYVSFSGCACPYCQKRYRSEFGAALPLGHRRGEQVIADYARFRCQSVYELLRDLATIAHETGRQFGVNLYDPYCRTPELYYGYNLDQIAPLLDYYLIENHALEKKTDSINNAHLRPLLGVADKPVFVVSYRDGIGYDPMYGQREIDLIWSDAQSLGYCPCYKGSEFVTNGIWHALPLDHLRPPSIRVYRNGAGRSAACPTQKRSAPIPRQIAQRLDPHYARLARLGFENKLAAEVVDRLGLMTWLWRMCHSPQEDMP